MEENKIRKYFWILLDVFIATLVVTTLFFVVPAVGRYADSLYSSRVLNVSAEGKTMVTPNLAAVSFSVVSQGKNPETLAENNNDKVSAAIEFVKSQGIEAKDIKTTGYNLSPDYQYDENTRRNYIVGYTMTQTVDVKIRNLDKVASVIGGLTPLGVNQVGGINFTVENQDEFLSEARAEAFAKVKAKASEIAKESGLRLGRIMNVNEYSSGPIPYYSGKGGASLGMGGDMALSAAPSVEPGTNELSLTVNITYELK